MKLVDSHCHVNDDKFSEDREEVFKRIENELEFIVNIGNDLPTSEETVKYSERYPFVYAVVGVHPTDISTYNDEVEKRLEELSKYEKTVAIGEIGLDYYWMEDEKEVQIDGFRRQMKLAEKVNLPVVIHSRDAMEDTLKVLNEFPNVKGVFHCYPGSFESAMNVPKDYVFGIGGVLTFKNARKTVEFIEKIDLSRVVIETDSPYLTPVPFRGKRNEPIYVKYIAKKIAEIKNIPVEEVIKITTENAKRIYNIK